MQQGYQLLNLSQGLTMKKTYFQLLIISVFIFIGCDKEEFPPSEYEIGHINLGSAYELFVEDDFAYVTYNNGLAIIDISDLNNPQKIKTFRTNDTGFGILVSEDIAFLGADNLKVIDINDKNNPLLISDLDVIGSIYGICKNSNRLYLSTWEGYFYIVDIENLSSPNIVSQINCSGNGTDIAYYNNTIYYSNCQKGLQVIDVTNEESPLINTIAPNSYGAWDLCQKNNLLFLGKHNRGFSIYEIGTDNLPRSVCHLNEGGEAYGIINNDDTMYVADLQDGLEIWNLNEIQNPQLVTVIEEYTSHDLTFKNGYLFLADQDRGFVILDMENI